MKILSNVSLLIVAAFVLGISPYVSAQSFGESPHLSDEIKDLFGLPNGPQPATQVNAKLWRSGQPTAQTLRALFARGVRVIIDLDDNLDVVAKEGAYAKKLGITFYSYPTNSFYTPDDAKMRQIIQILRHSQTPVLVHCYHGEDRTGLVIGLERVFVEGWTAEKAYDEMLDKGFHPLLLGLDQYFRDKVGDL